MLTGTRVSITPRYSDEDVIGLDEWSLLLEYWDGSVLTPAKPIARGGT